MIDPRDERIAQLERELARAQTDNITCQIEARLVMVRYRSTLDTALRVLHLAADELGMMHDGMAS